MKTTSAEHTEELAAKIGRRLKGGEVVELVSDLGGGKTTFVRGLARGFGSGDRVASPTFTISKVYDSNGKQLHHFDFYRLQDAGIIAHELEDLLGHEDIVVVIEWAEAVHRVLPEQRLVISFRQAEDDARTLEIDSPDSMGYLLEDVC